MSKRFFFDTTAQSPPLPKLVCMVGVNDLSKSAPQTEHEPLGAQDSGGTVFLSPASLRGDTDNQESRCSVTNPTKQPWTPNHVSQTSSDCLLREILATYYTTSKPLPAGQITPASRESANRSSAPENSGTPSKRQSPENIFPETPPTTTSTTISVPHTPLFPHNSPHPSQTPVFQPQSSVPQKQKNTCCLIDVLLRSPFTSLSCKQQKYVILIGKPDLCNLSGLPLNDLPSNSWITECKSMKRYFCWPCLLYQPQNSEVTYHSVQQHSLLPIHLKNRTMLNELLKSKQVSLFQPSKSPCAPLTSQPAPKVAPQGGNPTPSASTCIISLIERYRSCTSWWTTQRRQEIIKKGRPCPTLRCSTNPDSDLSDCERIYSSITWLAGSRNTNKFYCWPCLHFAANYLVMDPKTSFSRSVAEQHRLSKAHIWSSFMLKEVEKKIGCPSPPLLEINPESEYLKRFVQVECFVKTCSSDSQLDSSTINGLMDHVISADEGLRRQLRNQHQPYVRKAVVSSCVQHVVNERIREEVTEAPYVALILEDVSKVVDKSFIATFICYVSENGDPCERFLRFDCIAFDRSPKTILNLVAKVTAEFGIAQKLVGITYGGTVLDPFQTKSFHKELAQICPWVNFFNFGGHDLKKIILQSLSHIAKFRYFIQSLDYDFEMSGDVPQIFEYYNKDMLKKIMKDQGSRWFFMCLAASYKALARRYDDLASPNICPDADVDVRLFKSVDTQFLIVLLAKIFSKVEDLIKSMASGLQIRSAKSQFVLGLLTIEAEGYGSIFDDAKKLVLAPTEHSKPLDHGWYRETFDTTLKYVSEVVMYRTAENDLSALRRHISSVETSKDEIGRLLRRSNFQFHIERLMDQLVFTNKMNHFTDKTPIGLIRSIVKFRMVDSLSELHRFLRLVIVTSASDYDDESSSVKNMRTIMKHNRSLFLNLSNDQVRIESRLLWKLQKDPSFYTKCVESYKEILKNQNFPTSA